MAKKSNQKSGRQVKDPYDKAFKKAFQVKETARKFFEQFLPERFNRHIDYDHMRLENKSYVDEKLKEKHSDIIYSVRIKGRTGFLYILFEHQSSPDYWMIFRVLCYMVNIWKEFREQNPNEDFLPVIIPLLLYHGRTEWTSPKTFMELISDGKDFARILPDFEYHLVNCRDYDNDTLIEMCGDLSLGIVLFMMKNIFENRFEPVFKSLTDLFMKMQDNPDYLKIFEWALTYAYHARNEDEQELKSIIDDNISRMNDKKIMEVAVSVAEKIEQRGIEKGIEKGMEKGACSIVLKQLKIRFRQIPKNLEKKVKQADPDTLNQIAEAIFDLKTIEDVEKYLN